MTMQTSSTSAPRARTTRLGLLRAFALVVCALLIGAVPAFDAHAGRREPDWENAARNLELITQRISVDATTVPFRDFVEFLELATGASIEPLWFEDFEVGLNPDVLVTVEADDRSALTLLEQVLARVDEDFDEAAWQFDRDGNIQIGPKSQLNIYKYLVAYDIRDLLYESPDFTEAPELDLNAGGGQGGGNNIFQGDGGEDEEDFDGVDEERVEALIDLIVDLVEPLQWEQAGGILSIREYRGALLISAPEYVHRQLDGYGFYTAPDVSREARSWAFDAERTEKVQIAVSYPAPAPDAPVAGAEDAGESADQSNEPSEQPNETE